jgi:hypothetical protein
LDKFVAVFNLTLNNTGMPRVSLEGCLTPLNIPFYFADFTTKVRGASISTVGNKGLCDLAETADHFFIPRYEGLKTLQILIDFPEESGKV